MKDNSFSITISVPQTPAEAFAAISDPRRWWSGSIEGSTDQLGGEFTFKYKDMHASKQRVTELVPGSKVVWTVTDSALQFVEHKDEWTGTKIVFDIARKGDQTEVRFTHMGLVPELGCYGPCSKGWTQLLQDLEGLIASKAQLTSKTAPRPTERRA